MIISEEHLSGISFLLGGVFALLSFLILTRASQVRRAFDAFPRHRTIGLLLTAVALLWSAYLVDQMTLGDLSRFKWLLYIITPLSFYLIMQFLDELLAARAFGGRLMLVPTLMVDAARWHPSSWRLVVIVLAYAMVIAGIWLVLCPFKFRIWATWCMKDDRRHFAAAGSAILALLLLITGLTTG